MHPSHPVRTRPRKCWDIRTVLARGGGWWYLGCISIFFPVGMAPGHGNCPNRESGVCSGCSRFPLTPLTLMPSADIKGVVVLPTFVSTQCTNFPDGSSTFALALACQCWVTPPRFSFSTFETGGIGGVAFAFAFACFRYRRGSITLPLLGSRCWSRIPGTGGAYAVQLPWRGSGACWACGSCARAAKPSL